MKLLFVASTDSRACDWSGYALLRDNVQHFIEGGEPSRVAEAAHGFVAAILAVTERAVDGDLLEVRRYGDAPRFMSKLAG